MSSFALKLIAFLTMLIDHTAAVLGEMPPHLPFLWEHAHFLRSLGRVAFPLYAFLLVEGYAHTRDRRKYLLRMLGMAVLSQIPYALTINGGLPLPLALSSLNILFTLTFGLLLLCFLQAKRFDRIMRAWPLAVLIGLFGVSLLQSGIWEYGLPLLLAAGLALAAHAFRKEWLSWADPLLRLSLVLFAHYWLSYSRFKLFDADYLPLAFLLFAALFAFRERPRLLALAVAVWSVLTYLSDVTMLLFSCAAALLLLLYNGQRGPNDRRIFYWLYPAHLLLLWAVALVV